jgi:hypothetical protein
VKYQDFLSFVQGTEDENSIARNKDDIVAYITNTFFDKLTLKELVVRFPFHVKHLADGVKNIHYCFVPGEHYTCTPTYIYGKHIKSIIVENLEFQPHEARYFYITMEPPGWYTYLVENHELLKNCMSCSVNGVKLSPMK